MLFLKLQSELPGFFDPCVGEEKSLLIEYKYNGTNHKMKIKENEPLRLPVITTPNSS